MNLKERGTMTGPFELAEWPKGRREGTLAPWPCKKKTIKTRPRPLREQSTFAPAGLAALCTKTGRFQFEIARLDLLVRNKKSNCGT